MCCIVAERAGYLPTLSQLLILAVSGQRWGVSRIAPYLPAFIAALKTQGAGLSTADTEQLGWCAGASRAAQGVPVAGHSHGHRRKSRSVHAAAALRAARPLDLVRPRAGLLWAVLPRQPWVRPPMVHIMQQHSMSCVTGMWEYGSCKVGPQAGAKSSAWELMRSEAPGSWAVLRAAIGCAGTS